MAHAARERSVVNNSSSKQQFAFSKADRFTTPKKWTVAFGYEQPGFFGKTKPVGAGFGVREDRFGYEETKKHQRGVGNINDTQEVNTQTKRRTFSYSFGVSRSAMKKLHVDEILKKKEDNLPGPDRYSRKDQNTFGVSAGTESYSMRKKLGAFERHLGREKNLPGPGNYQQSNLTGEGLNSSTMRSAQQSSFPKSSDRFRPAKQQSPPATTYQVKDAINENFSSVRKYQGHTKIGTNTKTYIDQQWHLDRAKHQPAPGAYSQFSDFGGPQ